MMFITLIYGAYIGFKLQQLQIGHGSAALIFFGVVLMQLFFQLWRIKKIFSDVQVFHYIHNETDQGDQNKALSRALYGFIDTTFYWCGTVLVQLVLINKLLTGH
jgi:hypothetical protein